MDAHRGCGVKAAGALLAVGLALASGCASSTLGTARGQFHRGDFDGAAATLAELPGGDTDRVLTLMERGTINQIRARYADSIEDWQRAANQARAYDYLSISRGSASLVVNDNVLVYRGAPYERVLLHACAAQSYMGLGLWQDAAVEGRIIIRRLEAREDYPDCAFSRYVAALALELAGDSPGARFEYRKAAAIARHCAVDPLTGRLGPAGSTNAAALPDGGPGATGPAELVVIVGFGSGPYDDGMLGANSRWGAQPYAEVQLNGATLGRSYVLSVTPELRAATESVTATRQAVKTASRIAIKETIAGVIGQQNETLGELVRLGLYALETPDTRQWVTLPRWLGVARVRCPRDLERVDIVFRGSGDREVDRRTVTAPLHRSGNTYVTFLRAL